MQIIEGRVHKVLYTKCPVPASREILLDYGESYWDAWRKGGDPDDDPLMLAFLAVAAQKVGDKEAAAHFRNAFELTNRSIALQKRVADLIG